MSKLESFLKKAQDKSEKEPIPDKIIYDPAGKVHSSEESTAYDQGKLDYDSKAQNIRERKKYAGYIFFMVCIWLLIILLIVILQGVGRIPFTDSGFNLSEGVVITLVTTTTANIAAYFLVVTKYLFPNNKS